MNHEDIRFFASDIRFECMLLRLLYIRTHVKKCKDTFIKSIRTYTLKECPYLLKCKDDMLKACVLMLQSMCPHDDKCESLWFQKCVLTVNDMCP